MPISSPYSPLDVPDVDLWTLLFERESKPFLDSKVLFTDGRTGHTLDYGRLRSAALDFGHGLKALWGWRRGDVLAFYTPNSVDTPILTAGLLWAGGVASPANPLYTADELAFQLRDSGAKALVTQRPFLDVAARAAAAAGIPHDRIILIGEQQQAESESESDSSSPRQQQHHRYKHFSSIRATFYCSRYAQTLVEPAKDLAFLVYSSGTTGLPKGVCLTHRNIVANILQGVRTDGQHLLPHGGFDGKGDRLLGLIPFFHVYGLTSCILMTMYAGWEVILMERFDMERACQLIEKHRVTYIYVPPPVVLAFAKSPIVDKYDLTSLKMLHSGAAPLTRELTEALWDRLKLPVKQGYGLSETSPVVSIQMPEDWARFMGSIGKLVPGMEARLVSPDDGAEIVPGSSPGSEDKPGELWVRGPNVFAGYLNRPELTREAITEDGFFKTGDIVTCDRHGNLYCVDRLKELIKYKGFQVAPAELEGLLLGHADVLDCGVVGVQDHAAATEVPRAYVVLKQPCAAAAGEAEAEARARDITDWIATKVAPHKRLRGGVVFVPEIPKSPSGKILRRVLRDMVKQEERKDGAKL
ncbi:hypothetical protein RB597_008127 [Gaeumannomyces tritici]